MSINPLHVDLFADWVFELGGPTKTHDDVLTACSVAADKRDQEAKLPELLARHLRDGIIERLAHKVRFELERRASLARLDKTVAYIEKLPVELDRWDEAGNLIAMPVRLHGGLIGELELEQRAVDKPLVFGERARVKVQGETEPRMLEWKQLAEDKGRIIQVA